MPHIFSRLRWGKSLGNWVRDREEKIKPSHGFSHRMKRSYEGAMQSRLHLNDTRTASPNSITARTRWLCNWIISSVIFHIILASQYYSEQGLRLAPQIFSAIVSLHSWLWLRREGSFVLIKLDAWDSAGPISYGQVILSGKVREGRRGTLWEEGGRVVKEEAGNGMTVDRGEKG